MVTMTTRPIMADPIDACLNTSHCHRAGFTIVEGVAFCGQCRRPRRLYVEGMMEMEKVAGTRRHACGFCATGAHYNCSWAVANGDRGISFCACLAEPPKKVDMVPTSTGELVPHWHLPRCIRCGRRSASVTTGSGLVLPSTEVDLERAECVDPQACLDYRQSMAEKARLRFRPDLAGDHLATLAGEKDPEGDGHLRKTAVGSSQRRPIPKRGTNTKEKTMSESDFRVKAGGSKGTAVMDAIRDTKNHGLSRVQLAEKAGCTVGRVGEVIRFELAEGTAADKKAVQAFLNSVPARKAANGQKAVATKKTTTSKATATKKAAAKAPAKKTAAAKTPTKKAVAKKA